MTTNILIQRAMPNDAASIAVLVGDLLTEIMNVVAVPAFNFSLVETTHRLSEFLDKQKYFVPADKFDQEKVKAVFRNGILRITVPPKEDTTVNEGIKIEIIKEGE